MNLYRYNDYADYLKNQVEANKSDADGQWATEEEIKFLSEYLGPMTPAAKGICHGVKSGKEVEWFAEFSGADVFGTDVNPSSESVSDVYKHDFNEVKPDWIDKFDFIYSNAFDHSCIPETTLKRWMSCLKQDGKLIIEWTPAHEISCAANPFGASIHEYGEMIFRCGFIPKEILHFPLKDNPIKEKIYFVIEHKKEFVILCDGGLGNRIGLMLGGIVIARSLSMEPVLCWPENEWCGCSFKDAYETELKVLSHNIRELYDIKKDHTFMIHANQTGVIFKNEVPLSPEGIETIRKNAVNVVYFNDKVPTFIDNAAATKVLDEFPIKAEVFNPAANFCIQNKINNSVMGIHIRKTDGGQRMNEENLIKYIVNHQGIRCFVCSDDKATEDRFAILPGVIVFPKTEYPEKYEPGDWNKETIDSDGRTFRCNVKRSRTSIIEAFIDLLILSNTTISHGSTSTFFQLAKRYEHRRRTTCR